MSPIKGLSEKRRLPRLGKIHLGTRHPEKGYPVKTDYFVCPPEVQKVFGEKPKELRVLIPVEDEEKWAGQYYRCYSKTRGLICKGDGETAIRMIDTQTGAMADRDSKKVEMKEMPCQGRECPDYKTKCKEVMNLQFLLPEVPGLGIWQIDTSSINSIKNINSACDLIKGMFGRIAMVPLLLTLEPREVNNPEDGKKQTVFCLNLRTNATLVQLAGATRKQAELLEMPVGDDERPDLISPEFEPDEVELPPSKLMTEQEITDLWTGETTPKETVKPTPVVSSTVKGDNKPQQGKKLAKKDDVDIFPPDKNTPTEPTTVPSKQDYIAGFEREFLTSAMKALKWSIPMFIKTYAVKCKVKEPSEKLPVFLTSLSQSQREELAKDLQERVSMA